MFPGLLRTVVPCPSALLAYLLKLLCSALTSRPPASISYPLPCSGALLRHGHFLSYALQLAQFTGGCTLAAYIQDSIV